MSTKNQFLNSRLFRAERLASGHRPSSPLLFSLQRRSNRISRPRERQFSTVFVRNYGWNYNGEKSRKKRKRLTGQGGDVSGLLESRRVVVEIGDADYQVRGRFVNTVACDHLEAILGPGLGVQASPEDDLAPVSIDAERTWVGRVAESIGQGRGTVHVVGRDCGQHGPNRRTCGKRAVSLKKCCRFHPTILFSSSVSHPGTTLSHTDDHSR